MDLPITVTRYTSTSGDFSSIYEFDRGKIIEVLSSNVVSPYRCTGTAKRITLSFKDFPKLLQSVKRNEALGYGIHSSKHDDEVDLVVKNQENYQDGILCCTDEYFRYRDKPGILMLDCCRPYYRNNNRTITPNELMELLIEIDPQFENAARVMRESPSESFHLNDQYYYVNEGEEDEKVYEENEEDDVDQIIDKDFRLYFPVKNAADIPRYGKLLIDRLWLKGKGYITVLNCGLMLPKTYINANVFRPELFDVAGKPIIDKNEFEYTKPKTSYNNGIYLDTSILPDLTKNEKKNLKLEIENIKDKSNRNGIAKAYRWESEHIAIVKYEDEEDEEDIEQAKMRISSFRNTFIDEFEKEDSKIIRIKYNSNIDIEVYGKTSKFCFRYFIKLFDHSIKKNIEDKELEKAISSVYENIGSELFDPVIASSNYKVSARWWIDKNGIPTIDSFVHGKHITYYFDDDVYIDKPWMQVLDENAYEFNKKHANVMVNGKNRIMRLEPGSSISEGRMTYAFFARGELSKVYDNTKIKTAKKESKQITYEYKNIFMAWVTHPKARTYTGGVIFLPGKKTEDGYFNTWMGFGVKPNENSRLWHRIDEHIKNVICDGHSNLYDYFIRWIAYTIQNPDKPAGVAIVLSGEKGTGKSILGHFLRKIWGNHGLHITNPKHLVGSFNGHLADTCFLFADEAFFVGDKTHENILKGLVTEPMFIIERKGIDATQQPNYLKILMVTNSDYVVPVSRDERRYCVIKVANTYKDRNDNNTKYFDALNRSLNSKRVQSAFLYDMQNFDLTGWDIRDIPDRVGLRAQRYYTMNSLQHWFADSLNKGTFNTLGTHEFGISWFKRITTAQLYKSYTEWFKVAQKSEYKYVSQSVMSEYLGNIFERVKVVPGTKNSRGFNFGGPDNAKKLFQEYERIDLSEIESFEGEKDNVDEE